MRLHRHDTGVTLHDLPPSARRGPVVLDDRSGQKIPMNYLADMHMMALFPEAKERTLAEFGRLFRDTGFGEPRLIPTRSPYCVIETRPAR